MRKHYELLEGYRTDEHGGTRSDFGTCLAALDANVSEIERIASDVGTDGADDQVAFAAAEITDCVKAIRDAVSALKSIGVVITDELDEACEPVKASTAAMSALSRESDYEPKYTEELMRLLASELAGSVRRIDGVIGML